MSKNYWLFKSEPEEYSIDQLERDQISRWFGIRNYQARNYLKETKVGDYIFFYHSSCPQPGIYGLMTLQKEYYPDNDALDHSSKYFDKKSTFENNRWICVDVFFKKKFTRPILLKNLKETCEFNDSPLTKNFCRLSVIPITLTQFEKVLMMAN